MTPSTDNIPSKHWLRSQTAWSGLATIVLGFLAICGVVVTVPPEEIGQAAAGLVMAVGAIASGVSTIIGRFRASTRIEWHSSQSHRPSPKK